MFEQIKPENLNGEIFWMSLLCFGIFITYFIYEIDIILQDYKKWGKKYFSSVVFYGKALWALLTIFLVIKYISFTIIYLSLWINN